MKALLVSPNTESLNMPVYPVGMHLVADAVQSSGHEALTVDMFEHPYPWTALKREVQEFGPDAIGVTIRNIDDQSLEDTQFLLEGSREVVRGLKKLTSAPIIIGGAGYSIYPQSSLEYLGADMGLAGDGEITLPALLQAMEGRLRYDSVPGLYRPGIGRFGPLGAAAELDSCPLPDPGRVDPSRIQRDDFWMPYQTRRGCPLDCSYCSTGRIEGRTIRQRSVSRIVANLGAFQDAGVQRIFFVDNTFNLPRQYAQRLCQGMIQDGLDLTWCAIVYPKNLDPKLAQLMARAGCTQVSLGFESGSPEMLSALNKRYSLPEVKEAARYLAENGIKRMGFLLLGAPGETRDTVEQSLEFAESLELEALKITVGIRIYPGTLLAKQAVQAGVISPGDSLLEPRFYLEPGLKDWLPGRIREWSFKRPGFVVS